MRGRVGVGVVCSALALTTAAAWAQDAPAKAGDKKSNEVPKDPKGITGISPFWEAVTRGDAAFVARDFDTALKEYSEALKSEPQNAMGHYRMAETYVAKGQLNEASEALDAALRFAGNDDTLKAKILFVQADLRERAKTLDQATEKWTGYETFAKARPKAKTYPATPPERKKRIQTVKELAEQYAAVKERIAKREAELDAKARGKK